MKSPTASTINRRKLLLAAGFVALAPAAPWITGAYAATPSKAKTRRPLRLAVVPQLTPVEMYTNWSPLVEQFRTQGIPCELVIHPSIAAFESEFLEGKADLVYLNPYHMVMAQRARGYLPLVRSGQPLQGVLVTHKDSGIQAIGQLKEQRISFPAPNALAASLYIRAVLERDYKLPYEAHFAKNHRNAVRQVLTGDSAGAGIVLQTLTLESPDVKNNLQIIYSTPAVASHPLAVHPRVAPEIRTALHQQLKELAAAPESQTLIDAVMLKNLTDAQFERDYAPLQRLGLERYVIRESS